jgi:superfamily II DNA/RNA helicase
VLVFVKTRKGVEQLVQTLLAKKIRADSIHGDKAQASRLQALESFKAGEVQILVATDVAARGLDIDDLPHVVNFDLPIVAEDYIHRIGRTGRAGTTGSALCMVSPNDNGKWRAIQKLMDPNANNSDPEPFPRSARSRSGGGGYGGGQRRSGGGGGGGGYGQRREGASPQGFRSFGGGRRRSSGR